MSTQNGAARRGFLIRVMLGCAGAIGARFALGSATHSSDATLNLALRVVRAAQTRPSGLGTGPCLGTVPNLLAMVFDGAVLPELTQLTTGQLQRLLTQRIQQDYQKGVLLLHQGWWLARSEAALLQLRWLLAERDMGR